MTVKELINQLEEYNPRSIVAVDLGDGYLCPAIYGTEESQGVLDIPVILIKIPTDLNKMKR